MNYSVLGDEAIVKDIANQLDALRILKQLKESDLETLTGISRKTLYNFRQGKTALSLKNFIRLLRALGELDRLQGLFQSSHSYSPQANTVNVLPKRVRDKQIANLTNNKFKWGDES